MSSSSTVSDCASMSRKRRARKPVTTPAATYDTRRVSAGAWAKSLKTSPVRW